MRVIIFAGGIGTRLWPLSRKNSPKQFDKIFNGKSTLELAIERVEPLVGIENIFIQTTNEFVDAVRNQLPTLPKENIFIEPCRRNVGPAVCYGMMRLKNTNLHELENELTQIEAGNTDARAQNFTLTFPHSTIAQGRLSKGMERAHKSVALLWADHLMERVDEFQNALRFGDCLIQNNPNRFIFLAERPRFANNNLGWIKVGERVEECGRDAINRVSTTTDNVFLDAKSGVFKRENYFKFEGWKYKPETAECDKMFKSGNYYWNPGYFISSVDFILEQYEKLASEIYRNVKLSVEDEKNAFAHYEKCEKISFDRAIIEKTDLSNAVVIKTNMGWSDPGTLYALKEALEKSKEGNVVSGNIVELNTKDSLLYNFEDKKILTAVGLTGVVVINTKDAIIIVPKEEVVNVTKLVEKIGKTGYEEYL